MTKQAKVKNGGGRVRFLRWMPVLFLVGMIPARAQDLVEQVRVVNREVVVRVMKGGEPVGGLAAGDFILVENGRVVPITSCREVRRTLAPDRSATSASGRKGRVFLFLLWWNEANPEWTKVWTYFRDRIFRPGDRAILTNGRRLVQVCSPEKDKARLDAFCKGLKEDLAHRKLDKQRLVEGLRKCAQDFYENLFFFPDGSQIACLNDFKNRYESLLREYQLSRLSVRPAMMRRMATAMRAVEAEKWVLLFMQNERLPLLHKKCRLLMDAPMNQGTIAELGRFIEESNRKMSMVTDLGVRVREMQSLFIGAGATFHLFLSDAGGEVLDDGQLRWGHVFSSLEAVFKEVSRGTGGMVSDTTRLEAAVKTAASRPDIHYILTYKPEGIFDIPPKLRVTVNRPGLRALYARRLESREILPFKIANLVLRRKTLDFELSGFLREAVDGESPRGRIRLFVTARAAGRDPLEYEKILDPAGDVARVTLNIRFPERGNYLLEVNALDLISGDATQASTPVRVRAAGDGLP